MKKIIFICLLILVILISGCAQEKPTQEDKFVKDLIAKEEGEQLGTIELVEKCIYKDQTIYHLVAGCCDFFNGVYNKNSDKICSTGGLTGRGDGIANLFGKPLVLNKVKKKNVLQTRIVE